MRRNSTRMKLAGLLSVRYRRTTLLYLAAIVLPTMVLLGFGLQSLRQQAAAFRALRVANSRMTLERTAERFEQDVARLATAALRDRNVEAVRALLEEPPGPANQRRLRGALTRLSVRHPVAEHLFVLEDGRPRFPRASEPVPRDWRDAMDALPAPVRSRVARALSAAEGLETHGRPSLAAQAYLRCLDPSLPSDMRALLRLRAANAMRSAGNTTGARRLLRVLRDEHQDDYDLFHRPYALVASVELAAWRGEAAVTPSAVADDVAAGRWELSADQASYFLDRLGEPARRGKERPTPTFLQELELARVLSASVRPQEVAVEEVVGGAVPSEPAIAYYYTALDRTHVLGLVVDRKWAAQAILREGRDGAGDTPQLFPASTGGGDSAQAVRLRPPFNGFVLRASPGAAAAKRGWRDDLVIVAGMLGVLSVLLLGVVLVVRDASRETQIARMRSDFVSGVSHQVRTPLTLIRLYAEMLTESEDLPPADRKAHLDVIAGESRRLTTLVERVLDFSRVDHGQRAYVMKAGDLAGGVRPIVEAYLPHLKRLGFTTDVMMADDLPTVHFDQAAVADAVGNLLDNAVKYSTDRRYIAVRMFRAPVGVVLEVEDAGVGIPSDERSTLFEPFRRGTALAEKGGYGLGLYLVRDMIEAHGGAIEVESRVAVGSTFRLVFPAQTGAHA